MSRSTTLVLGLGLLLVSATSLAETVGLKLCTGSPDGNYFASGEEIKRQVQRQSIQVELVATGGSMDNLKRMADGECDAGFAQIDAYLHYQALNRESRLAVEWPKHLYEEYVHLVCHRDSRIASIEDFAQAENPYSLVVGAPGSGSAMTWDSFTRLNPDYLVVTTKEADGAEALQSVKEGNTDCMMLVSGLGSKQLSLVDASAAQLRLVGVDDRDLQQAKHFGKPIYQFQPIPAGTYPGLQAPSGKSVETLTVKAIMLVASAWAGAHAVAYEALIEGVDRATPIIQKRVTAN